MFSQAGAVDNVRVMRDMATGRARGFAFVEMANDEARRRRSRSSTATLDGRPLVVNEARPEAGRRSGVLHARRRWRWPDGGGRREPRW